MALATKVALVNFVAVNIAVYKAPDAIASVLLFPLGYLGVVHWTPNGEFACTIMFASFAVNALLWGVVAQYTVSAIKKGLKRTEQPRDK